MFYESATIDDAFGVALAPVTTNYTNKFAIFTQAFAHLTRLGHFPEDPPWACSWSLVKRIFAFTHIHIESHNHIQAVLWPQPLWLCWWNCCRILLWIIINNSARKWQRQRQYVSICVRVWLYVCMCVCMLWQKGSGAHPLIEFSLGLVLSPSLCLWCVYVILRIRCVCFQ